MTELLDPAQPDSAPTAAPGTTEKPGTAVSLVVTSGPGAPERASAQDRFALLPADEPTGDVLSAEDLQGVPTRHLRILANQAYKLMDTDYPPADAVDGYRMIVDELEGRAQQARRRPEPQLKETFRDNPLYCRFELFVDGTLAAYLRYTMTAGRVVLTDGVEHPGFRDQGIDVTLMRHVVLNAHKRRLSLVPQCPMAFSFLADHPQYQALAARPPH
ncbi:GNAT family N-acetyltransferase [Arthrobacter sp. MDT1-65]